MSQMAQINIMWMTNGDSLPTKWLFPLSVYFHYTITHTGLRNAHIFQMVYTLEHCMSMTTTTTAIATATTTMYCIEYDIYSAFNACQRYNDIQVFLPMKEEKKSMIILLISFNVCFFFVFIKCNSKSFPFHIPDVSSSSIDYI